LGEVSLRLDDAQFTELESLTQLDFSDLATVLTTTGIDSIALQESLDVSEDWFNFSSLGSTYQNMGEAINFRVDVSGTSVDGEISNFNRSLNAAIRTEQGLGINFATGVDLLANYANPEKFGNLVSSLLDSGVTDFVVESGNVEITDILTAAMVESGMLHALPSANLIINATENLKLITGLEDFAHLYTDLKSMAELDVDGIRVNNGIDKVFINLGDLDSEKQVDAILEIKALLASLDPANAAKPVDPADSLKPFAQDYSGKAVDISLVMSAELAVALNESLADGGLNHLQNLGITQIIGLDPNATSSVPAPVAQTPVPLPEVKIIGPNGDDGALFNELNHNKLV
jgi:hypothetical protein